jgi:hypothetical protein
MNDDELHDLTVKIFDLNGKEVYRQVVGRLDVNTTLEISTLNFANGVYQVALQNGDGFKNVKKLVIAK